jgi:hypothetical protein
VAGLRCGGHWEATRVHSQRQAPRTMPLARASVPLALADTDTESHLLIYAGLLATVVLPTMSSYQYCIIQLELSSPLPLAVLVAFMPVSSTRNVCQC